MANSIDIGENDGGMLKQTFEELRLSGHLPSPSGVGMRILTLTQGEDYSTEEIALAIQADPALTGRLLKLANSADAGSREPIATVNEATMRLGVRAVRNVALGLSLVSANREGGCRGFDYDAYWADSLVRAVAAQSISRLCGVGIPAEAYVCGLLSCIGRLAFASVYPDEYAELLAVADGDVRDTIRREREAFAISDAEIGAYMLDDWGLPEGYGQAIRVLGEQLEKGEHPHASAGAKLSTMPELLCGASLIAEVCLSGDNLESYRELLDALRDSLDLEPERFQSFLDAIVEEWREWGSILTIPTDGSIDVPEPPDERAISDAAAAAGGPRTAKVLELSPGIGLRVLAVDDDPMQLKVVARYLTNLGAHVRTAQDGRQALQIALSHTPQIVLADWMMPGIDGVKLCRVLRKIKQGREMYYVLLTGREEEDRIVEAFDAGVDDYVVKPFNPKLLLARIKAGKRVVELENERSRDRRRLVKQAADISRLNRRLKALALTDLLTELRNRRYAMERLAQEWASCNRTGKPLSVVMVDIDYFKRVNDTHGHDAGDAVLKDTARIIRQEIRTGDDAVRIGGEEFLVICFGTREEQAYVCAERVRKAVEANLIQCGDVGVGVTISLGVAQRSPDMCDIDDLLKAADDAVYEAKHRGRNQTCQHNEIASRKKSA